MLKHAEIRDANSCFNRADDDEPMFVLLGRDITAISTIHHWILQRVVAGKNQWDDIQIQNAFDLCCVIGEYQARRRKSPEHIGKPDGEQAPDF